MVKPCLVLFLVPCALACHSDPKSIAAEPPTDSTNLLAAISMNPIDSLRNPTNYFYLSDLPTRAVGEMILSGSIKALQNEVSYRCLDSLATRIDTSRSFYLKVFSKIISNSDGALSEVVGEYAKKYIETYPGEFATYASGFSKSQMELWAYQTVEYVLGDVEAQRIKDASEWTNKINKGCKDCSPAQMNTLKQFNSIILVAAKDREDTN
jgi:hypothetical protein